MQQLAISLNKRPIKLLVSILVLTLLVLFVNTSLAHAQTSVDAACQGIGLTSGNGCGTAGSGTDLSNAIQKIINIISAIVGLVAVVMVVIGGFKYITSNGDSNNIASAKNTIIYAIVGLVVVAFAQIIVHFAIKAAS